MRPIASLIAVLLCVGLAAPVRGRGPAAAPPFRTQDPSDWVGTPVTWEALRGKVVLIDVWTFG